MFQLQKDYVDQIYFCYIVKKQKDKYQSGGRVDTVDRLLLNWYP